MPPESRLVRRAPHRLLGSRHFIHRLLGSAAAAASGVPEDPAPAAVRSARQDSIGGLRERARAILAEVQDGDLPLSDARRQVEQLLGDLRGLGETEGWTPLRRRLELTIARPEDLGPALAEECPLFFEEELVRLCPLDQARSEIWGSRVLVCEFACAPEPEP